MPGFPVLFIFTRSPSLTTAGLPFPERNEIILHGKALYGLGRSLAVAVDVLAAHTLELFNVRSDNAVKRHIGLKRIRVDHDAVA